MRINILSKFDRNHYFSVKSANNLAKYKNWFCAEDFEFTLFDETTGLEFCCDADFVEQSLDDGFSVYGVEVNDGKDVVVSFIKYTDIENSIKHDLNLIHKIIMKRYVDGNFRDALLTEYEIREKIILRSDDLDYITWTLNSLYLNVLDDYFYEEPEEDDDDD